MDKQEMCFEDFLSDISPEFTAAAARLHEVLTGLGCQVKLQQAKSGHVVSYNHPASKKAVANFVSRKKGPVIRIYGDNAASYLDFLETLPQELEAMIGKAPVCRRMLDPTKCNSRCPMGYDFTLKNTRHQKCRFGCFMFPMTEAALPYLQSFLEREMALRSA